MRNPVLLAGSLFALLSSTVIAAAPPASDWTIGPIIRGKNYSVGMPLQPQATRDGWAFDFPAGSRRAGHVHYVTFDPGSLSGKSKIVVRYRVQGAGGARFVPQERPDLPATVSLYLQRQGDSWTGRGRFNFYRWYAPPASVQEISPGVHQMSVRLDDPRWGAVMNGNAGENRQSFQAALADPAQVGLVFGSSAGRGHGVYSTAPARFELLDFRIE